MNELSLDFTLSFEGLEADSHEVDFYDVAQALVGFQRSLALSTHLVLTGEVITHAPALRGARVLAVPPLAGSWKFNSKVIMMTSAIALYHITTAPRDTPLGNLVSSAYDYVVSEALGFHVDYKKTIGRQLEEIQKKTGEQLPKLDETRFDSVIEKCERAIKDMHRPIMQSKTAECAKLSAVINGKKMPFHQELDRSTFEYMDYTTQSHDLIDVLGIVSSYNVNTYKGRIFVPLEGRPIPFILADQAKNRRNISRITNSLSLNARDRMKVKNERLGGEITCRAYRFLSRTGKLKGLLIVEVA